jgi:hypothetical protein
MEVSDQLHAPPALPAGKQSPIPIVQEAGWAGCGKEENLYRESNPGSSVVEPIA